MRKLAAAAVPFALVVAFKNADRLYAEACA
jgi:hypothetical protein